MLAPWSIESALVDRSIDGSMRTRRQVAQVETYKVQFPKGIKNYLHPLAVGLRRKIDSHWAMNGKTFLTLGSRL